MIKKTSLILLTWILSLLLFSFLQENYGAEYNIKIFPSYNELLPRPVLDIKDEYLKRFVPGKQENENIAAETKTKKSFYTGKDFKYLKRFYKKLNELENNKRDVVRILHFGDSTIWGDNFTSLVKRRFQKDFSDGGRGIVPAVYVSHTRLKDNINNTNKNFFRHKFLRHFFMNNGVFRIKPEKNFQLGFTGESTRPIFKNSKINFSLPEGLEPWNKVQLFVRSPENSTQEDLNYQFNLKYNGQKRVSKKILMKPGSLKIIDFNVNDARNFELDFKGSKSVLPYIDAINLETGKGLVYNTIIRMGIHLAWLDAIPEKNFKESIKSLNPDLIIFQFGINESASINAFKSFTPEFCREEMKKWLEKVKLMLPDADILMIGSYERLKKDGPVLKPMEAHQDVINIQRQISRELNIAFFDTYNFFGGRGQMKGLVKSGMAMTDYTHLSIEGGKYFAKSFYDVMINTYKNYLGKTEEVKKLEALKISKEKNIAIQFNSKAYAYFLITVIIFSMLISRFPGFRVFFLIIVSYYFYTTWKVWPVILIIGSTLLDYYCSGYIGLAQKKGKRGTFFLVLSLVGNLGLLFTFKYFDFISKLIFTVTTMQGSPIELPLLNTILPVGISFYTFQSLSYTIDVWRGEMKPEHNILKFGLFVTFFPQLVAGPIVRAKEFIPTMNAERVHFKLKGSHVTGAIFLIITGLVKKMGADWLAANIIDRVYDNPEMFTSAETITAVYAYGLQIYGDFSGYTDIALGSAMLLGYNLTENFRRPYISFSITDFWRRWHISLGSWFRDYLYISLGGNRKRVYFNLFITMFLCGLWHGAGLNFVVWGMYHGFFLIMERFFGIGDKFSNSVIRFIRTFITFHIIILGWIIFRSNSMDKFTGIINSIIKLDLTSPNLDPVIVSVIILFFLMHLTPIKWKDFVRSIWDKFPAPVMGFVSAVFTMLLYNISITGVKPFIYFQF